MRRVLVGAGVLVLLGGVAAIAGTFFVGIGCQAAPPQATFQYEYYPANDSVRILHDGGDVFSATHLEFFVTDPRGEGKGDGRLPIGGHRDSPGTIKAEDTIVLAGVEPGDHLRIVWDPPKDPCVERTTVGTYTVQRRTNES